MEEENDEGYTTFVEGEDDSAEEDEQEYEEVCAPLRDLPYIKQDTNHEIHGSPGCVWANWNSLANAINKGYPAEDVRFTTETKFIHESNPEEVPSHVIGLADNTPEDPNFLLDTIESNIYWLHCPDTICRDDDLVCEMVTIDEENYPEIERDWRTSSMVWKIPDFLELLKDQFRRLNYIPLDEFRICDAEVEDPGLITCIQPVFREHGWPDLGRYRKQGCLEAVERETAAWYERKRQLKESASTEQHTESVTTVSQDKTDEV